MMVVVKEEKVGTPPPSPTEQALKSWVRAWNISQKQFSPSLHRVGEETGIPVSLMWLLSDQFTTLK
jgi:hypothetical protein